MERPMRQPPKARKLCHGQIIHTPIVQVFKKSTTSTKREKTEKAPPGIEEE